MNQDPSHLEAVLFDLDGTLVDSAIDLMDALNVVLAGQGLRTVSHDETVSMIGDGALKLLERGLAATGGDASRGSALLGEFLTDYEARATAHTRAYAGVPEVMASLARRSKLAVVTNKPAAAARRILDALDLTRHVGAVIGGDTTAHRKPHPAPLLAALEQLDARASNSVMVGDNHHDVDAARAAGLRCVVVSYGYSHRPPRSLGADAVIDAFDALPDALSQIFPMQAAQTLRD